MKGRTTRKILFTFWLILATLSASWLILNLLGNVNLILIESVYQFVFIITFLSFFISVLSLHITIVEVKSKINEESEKQKNIRDYYQYTQLLNPPSMDN